MNYSSQYFSERNQCQQIDYEAGLIDPDFLEEGHDKELRMIRRGLTKVLKPEHNLSKLFLCLFLQDQFNMNKSKLNWGLMSGIYPAV